MNRKKIVKAALWTLGVSLVLFVVLVVHVAMVLPKSSDARIRQLSRIDFNQPIDSAEAGKIQSHVAQLEGVESTYFNVPDGVLVYTYAVGQQTSANVYKTVMGLGNYKAAPYVVTEAQAQGGCPMDSGKNSVVYRLASWLSAYI